MYFKPKKLVIFIFRGGEIDDVSDFARVGSKPISTILVQTHHQSSPGRGSPHHESKADRRVIHQFSLAVSGWSCFLCDVRKNCVHTRAQQQ